MMNFAGRLGQRDSRRRSPTRGLSRLLLESWVNFVFKMMNVALKIMNIAFKMMNSVCRPCIDPWLPGNEKNKCQMVYQYSTKPLSDPFLANWTLVRWNWSAEEFCMADPGRPTARHHLRGAVLGLFLASSLLPRYGLISCCHARTRARRGRTRARPVAGCSSVRRMIKRGCCWRQGSKNGSNWSGGFESLGNFFPTTGDSRCSIPTGCGYFTPSFANGVAVRGEHLLWGTPVGGNTCCGEQVLWGTGVGGNRCWGEQSL